MYIPYPNNDSSSYVQYVRNKIGNNYFIVYYKNVAQFKKTPKEVGRVFGIAKFTPYVNELRDWCKEMVEKYGGVCQHHETSTETQQMEGRRDETRSPQGGSREIEGETKERMVI